MSDLLYQKKFSYAHFPEIVNLAVIATGLGALQNGFSFVKQSRAFWDSTYWDVHPRPFLDANALAYANAVAAWARNENDPAWADGLISEAKRPMKKSLKYLLKTNDCFFDPSSSSPGLLEQSQGSWLELAKEPSISKQVIAIRSLTEDEMVSQQQEALLLDKLRSPERAVILHSISAVESLKLDGSEIVDELRMLAENRDDEIRAKAMIALTRLAQLDESTIGLAAKMLGDQVKYVSYAGLLALSSLETVREPVLRVAEGGLLRALQSCDFEFVGLYAVSFTRWLEDPRSHFEELLQGDKPEYLRIVLDALEQVEEQVASLR